MTRKMHTSYYFVQFLQFGRFFLARYIILSMILHTLCVFVQFHVVHLMVYIYICKIIIIIHIIFLLKIFFGSFFRFLFRVRVYVCTCVCERAIYIFLVFIIHYMI